MFLEVRNFIYDGSTFVPNYTNHQLKEEISTIVKDLYKFRKPKLNG